MKKLSILLLSALLLIASFAFASCDQESVDNTLNNLMEQSAEMFDSVFKKTESSLENDGNYDEDANDEDEGNGNEAESNPSDSTEENTEQDPNTPDSTEGNTEQDPNTSDSTEGNTEQDPNTPDNTGEDTTEEETDTSLGDDESI